MRGCVDVGRKQLSWWCDGPWSVYLNEDGSIWSDVPYEQWLITVRCPALSKGSGSSCTVRHIDDCLRSCLNLATCAVEKMGMTGIPALRMLAQWVGLEFRDWGEPGEPLLAKGRPCECIPQLGAEA